MINGGILIDGLHSFRDFGLIIGERQIGAPIKRTIRQGVPHSNGEYDFSNINGNVTFEAREIDYSFDIVENSVEEMEEKRSAVLSWLELITDAEIYDDYLPGYYFRGSSIEVTTADEDVKTTIAVKFRCYPFKISQTATVWVAEESQTLAIFNSGLPVRPSVSSLSGAAFTLNGTQYSIPGGQSLTLAAVLKSGITQIVVSSGDLTLSFKEERI